MKLLIAEIECCNDCSYCADNPQPDNGYFPARHYCTYKTHPAHMRSFFPDGVPIINKMELQQWCPLPDVVEE